MHIVQYLDDYKSSINGGSINTHIKQTFLCSNILGNAFSQFQTKKGGGGERAPEYLSRGFFQFLKKIINWFQS